MPRPASTFHFQSYYPRTYPSPVSSIETPAIAIMDDDSSMAWPAWKFGMKRADLFTTLHDQYNTYSCPIQEDTAFYHDIFETSHQAHSIAEFHLLASSRKQQRLEELNDAFLSASLEIIGNPNLIRSPQWEHALHLFRNRSLDSLVRFFASYLPEDHIWYSLHHATASVGSSSNPADEPDEECEHAPENNCSLAGRKRKYSGGIDLLESRATFTSVREGV